MKKNVFILCLITLTAIACKKEAATPVKPAFDSVAAEESKNEELNVTRGCYMATEDEDTIYLKVEDNLGTVIGKMKATGKNAVSGDLTGLTAGDTLKVTLMPSTGGQKEIWFLKKNGDLQEATAKYEASGEYYTDDANVKFGDGRIYKNADCERVNKVLN